MSTFKQLTKISGQEFLSMFETPNLEAFSGQEFEITDFEDIWWTRIFVYVRNNRLKKNLVDKNSIQLTSKKFGRQEYETTEFEEISKNCCSCSKQLLHE